MSMAEDPLLPLSFSHPLLLFGSDIHMQGSTRFRLWPPLASAPGASDVSIVCGPLCSFPLLFFTLLQGPRITCSRG